MSSTPPTGDAVLYCERALGTTSGKTAHGLIRLSRRFRIRAVVDSTWAGRDAGEVLDGHPRSIPVYANVREAVESLGGRAAGRAHLIVGLAPDGGRLSSRARRDLAEGIGLGLDVISGLHDRLEEDPWLGGLAREHGVALLDIRKPPPLSRLHFFSGRIEEVESSRIAVLGTDSAVGKRTTAWMLVDALVEEGLRTELIGTGQTAWLQGARYSIVLDAIVNDFVTGEIEHAVHTAYRETGAEALIIEGQGSLMNPAYPGGFEILAAARPDAIVLQHAPARREYDGLPGYALHPLDMQITALELVSQRPVVAVTVNGEGLGADGVAEACAAITSETGLPAVDPLRGGVEDVLDALRPHLPGGSGHDRAHRRSRAGA